MFHPAILNFLLERLIAFITPEGTYSPSEELSKELKQHAVREIGALVFFTQNSCK